MWVSLSTRPAKKLVIFRKLRKYLDWQTSFLIYKSLILLHMDYCSLVYTSTDGTNIKRLQLVQNAACSAILPLDNRANTQNIHKELNISTIRERISFKLSFECFKQINVPGSSLSKFFRERECIRTTRSSNMKTMEVPNFETSIGRGAFSFKGPTHWNK